MSDRSGEMTLAGLRPLAEQYPTVDAALGEMARLAAELTLPKGTIHVISDVHGEDGKLRHVLNNASGTLRPAPRSRTMHATDPAPCLSIRYSMTASACT